jgi:hypothetical protein
MKTHSSFKTLRALASSVFMIVAGCAIGTEKSEDVSSLSSPQVAGFNCPGFGWYCGDGVHVDHGYLLECLGSGVGNYQILLRDDGSGGVEPCTAGCNDGPTGEPAFCNGGFVNMTPSGDPGYGWWCGATLTGGNPAHLYFFDHNGNEVDLGNCPNSHCNINANGPDYCDPGSTGCPSGQTNCSGSCVDISSNSANCGGCGIVCGRGSHCSHGSCVCPDGSNNTITNPVDCGQCGNICPRGPCLSSHCL